MKVNQAIAALCGSIIYKSSKNDRLSFMEYMTINLKDAVIWRTNIYHMKLFKLLYKLNIKINHKD